MCRNNSQSYYCKCIFTQNTNCVIICIFTQNTNFVATSLFFSNKLKKLAYFLFCWQTLKLFGHTAQSYLLLTIYCLPSKIHLLNK